VAAAAQPGRPGRLGMLLDESNSVSYLVDTGAVFSVVPFKSTLPPTGPKISAADGTPIPCWGWERRVITAGGRQFEWSFLMAAVAFPLIGTDFLVHHKLSVDLVNMQLRRSKRPPIKMVAPPAGGVFATVGVQLVAPSRPGVGRGTGVWTGDAVDPAGVGEDGSSSDGGGGPAVLAHVAPPDYAQILAAFPTVVNPSKQLPQPSHGVEHHIETTGPPVAAKYRRLDAERLAAAKKEFADLEKQGIIRRSKSQWASPLHMVRKADGSWRPCGDYRRLNVQTVPDRYTCPNIGDLTARLAGCKVFSKLDLRKGYHQIPVREADIAKTAIITPFGLFEFRRTPFGLRNAGQTFQRMMDQVLWGLPYCFVYLDDILVASTSHEEHVQHLQEVLTRLQQHGLVLNAEKCVLGVESVDYLGHQVSASGISPLPDRVAAITKFPRPTTVRGLQTYLGMVNFYRRFLRGAAQVLRPLTNALVGQPAGQLTWTGDMVAAFEASKAAMCSAAELAHPVEGAELSLVVDASATHVGAVLQQRAAGSTRPLSFFSRKLDAAQQKYSAFDRELLACYLSIRHFRWLLEGRVFHVLTDHKPLTFALHRQSDAWSARQQRHLAYVAEFTSDVRHVPGKENVVADALSRPAAVVAPSSSPSSQAVVQDWPALARAQSSCVETQELAGSTSLQVEYVQVAGASVLCDVSTGVLRPLVPVEQRRAVFEAVHNLAHPGIKATQRMVASRFVWRGCAAQVASWCRDCGHCARGKVTRQESTAVEQIPVPEARFWHVHVDIVGPLPTARDGYSYLLTVIDRASRWPEVFPLRGITAMECVDTFASGWVARYGVPHTVTTDKGTQFTGAVWKSLCSTLGIQHVTTTAFHPQSNGMVERLHRQLKEGLRARDAGVAWLEHLPWVVLGIRAAPKEDSGVSAAEVLFGSPLIIPGQLQHPAGVPPPTCRGPAIPLRERGAPERARSGSGLLDGAQYVYVRRGVHKGPLEQAYVGPYRVLERSDKLFKLQIGDRVETVSADRLKPHTGADPQPAQPPRRGRPPGTGGSG